MQKKLVSRKNLINTVTVDPGWNTGLAYWVGDLTPVCSIIKEPPKNKVIKLEPTRLNYMYNMFEAYLSSNTVDLCVMEGVEMWMGSTKSMTAASRGNLFSLAYIIGGYISICNKKSIEVKLVYPRGGGDRKTWKGQLSASQIEERIKLINGMVYKEHIREAVAIGFSTMGIL